MDLYEEFRGLIEVFNRNDVDYAVCGGIAVAIHGYPRFTYDIDLLIRPQDLSVALDAAKSCGFLDESGRIPLGSCVAYRVVKSVGSDHLVLDLILINEMLRVVWDSRTDFQWQGLRLCVVSSQGLATMKRMSGRDQDLLDLKMLEGEATGGEHGAQDKHD